jgi:asparagine synthase (glutamine-hydrolysing)
MSWVKLIRPEVQQQLLSEFIAREAVDPLGDRYLRNYLSGGAGRDLMDSVALVDVAGYLPEYQLAYMDRMSMAVSLEVRAPLCDFEVAEFALGLPTEFRLRRTRSKHILKEVAKRYLPEQIVDRKKVGFDSPIGQWFKDELRPFLESFLAPDQIARSGMLRADVVQKIVSEHLNGRRNYALQLWSIVALEAWYRMYMEPGVGPGGDVLLSDIRGGSLL